MPDDRIELFPNAKAYVEDEEECIIKRNQLYRYIEDPLVIQTVIMLNKWLIYNVLPFNCGFEEMPYNYDICLYVAISEYHKWKAEKEKEAANKIKG